MIIQLSPKCWYISILFCVLCIITQLSIMSVSEVHYALNFFVDYLSRISTLPTCRFMMCRVMLDLHIIGAPLSLLACNVWLGSLNIPFQTIFTRHRASVFVLYSNCGIDFPSSELLALSTFFLLCCSYIVELTSSLLLPRYLVTDLADSGHSFLCRYLVMSSFFLLHGHLAPNLREVRKSPTSPLDPPLYLILDLQYCQHYICHLFVDCAT